MADQRYSKSLQIAEDYKTFLRRQRLKAGSRVGSVRKLMQMYNISLGTADKVLRILTEENFVYRTPSSGTFIKHDLQGELQIGFTENDYCSADSSAFRLMNLRRVKKALREENIVPFYVSYNDLLTPESAEKVFSKIKSDSLTSTGLASFSSSCLSFSNSFISDRLPNPNASSPEKILAILLLLVFC